MGNNYSIFTMLGASNHTDKERETDDYYATSPEAIDKLLTVEVPNRRIWECAAGGGHLSKRLKEYGFDVYSTDIKERGYPLDGVQDFLTTTEEPLPFKGGGVRYFDKPTLQARQGVCIKSLRIVA